MNIEDIGRVPLEELRSWAVIQKEINEAKSLDYKFSVSLIHYYRGKYVAFSEMILKIDQFLNEPVI